MEEIKSINSFVIRCSCINVNETTGKKIWRIKIKNVHGEEEVSVQSLEEMVFYMKRILGE